MVGQAQFRQAKPPGGGRILARVALRVFAERAVGVIIRSHEII